MTTTENTSPVSSFAPSTAPTLGLGNSFLLLRCDEHGTKECADFDSARRYVDLMRACQAEVEDVDHQRWHYEEEHSCWVDGACCVVDPYGMFDH